MVGCGIDFEDVTQLTAIQSAVILHQTESVKLFFEQGASIDLDFLLILISPTISIRVKK